MKITTPLDCSINTLNNKAIVLVKNGEGRNAVKLFLQALSSLKSEITCGTKCSSTSSSSCHDIASEESPLIRIAVPVVDGENKTAPPCGRMATYDIFFGLDPKINPCTPQHRDGSTACILYNMAVTEHHMGLKHEENLQGKTVYLKKAINIYNMALSAALHWKKYTDQHLGCQILSLAILNNLLTIHYELKHASKVADMHTLLRDTLFCHPSCSGSVSKADDISCEELSLFAKNLQLCSSMGASSSSDQTTTTVQQAPSAAA